MQLASIVSCQVFMCSDEVHLEFPVSVSMERRLIAHNAVKTVLLVSDLNGLSPAPVPGCMHSLLLGSSLRCCLAMTGNKSVRFGLWRPYT